MRSPQHERSDSSATDHGPKIKTPIKEVPTLKRLWPARQHRTVLAKLQELELLHHSGRHPKRRWWRLGQRRRWIQVETAVSDQRGYASIRPDQFVPIRGDTTEML